jgi:hypothetical protein
VTLIAYSRILSQRVVDQLVGQLEGQLEGQLVDPRLVGQPQIQQLLFRSLTRLSRSLTRQPCIQQPPSLVPPPRVLPPRVLPPRVQPGQLKEGQAVGILLADQPP